MAVHVLDAMAREGFEEVVAIHDHRSGLRAFLAVHDTSAGPALGGIRRFPYRDEKEALLDCLRLALHMSFKCVLAGIEGGGAKLVVLDRGELDRAGAYRHLGEVIERFGGRYYAGPDVGTGREELAWVAERTRYSTDPGAPGFGDLADATAAGVFAGMAAGLRLLDGAPDWPRRRIVIQGLGSVGRSLARRLLAEGAAVSASDIETASAAAAARELGIELLEAGDELASPCDVLAPCAMGGSLHDLSIPRMKARLVCGAANNQLARARHAERLHARGVLYVPDFVVNAGALLRGATLHTRGELLTLDELERRIGAVAERVLSAARAEDEPPARVAEREARLELERRREGARRPRAAASDVGPSDTATPSRSAPAARAAGRTLESH